MHVVALAALRAPLPHCFRTPLASIPECSPKIQMPLDGKRLRTRRAVEARGGELGVDFFLVAPAAGPTAERLPQVLPSLRVEIAKEGSPSLPVVNATALLWVWLDEHDRGIDFGPRPEVGRRQSTNDLDVRDRLQEHSQR